MEAGNAITVEPVTVERVPDVLTVLGIGPGTQHCTCQYWRLTSGEFSRTTQAGRVACLQKQASEEPGPGMIAYVDGEPAAWCGFGVRQKMGRLVRSRTIPLIDDLPVWSIVCFETRTGYRRRGLARLLLDGVIAYARRLGVPALEAYPIDPEGKRVSTSLAYVGTVSMFQAAGFEKAVKTDSTSARLPRWLMRLTL